MVNCEELEKPPGKIASAIVIDPDSQRRTILVTPRGDERLYQGRVHHTLPLDAAVDRVVGNTTLLLLAGKYYRATDLVRKRGEKDKPIIVEGMVGPDGQRMARICGSNAAGSIYPDLPDRDDYAFFRLRGCKHIVFRNMSVESCWPSFIYAERCSHLKIEEIDAQDGSYFVFLRGPDSEDIIVRNCSWIQDPTGTLWSTINWIESHHGAYAYYNGAFVGGIDVLGDIDISGNVIKQAYNGVRFTTTDKRRSRILGRFNVNVLVRDNHFENLRDNVVEPEKTLLNWHIFNNVIKNTHAAFSIHDFFGGYLYIYGNRIWFDGRGGADYQDNRGGKIYKLRNKGPLPDHPIHIFHNSIFSRTFLIKKARSRYLFHRNNAIQFCSPLDFPECVCKEDRAFLKDFPVDGDKKPLPWDDSVVFNGDASSKAFGEMLKCAKQEKCGIVTANLGFTAAKTGDFTPTASSELRNAGLSFTLESCTDLPSGQARWNNWPRPGKPHIGAVQEPGMQIALPYQPMSRKSDDD